MVDVAHRRRVIAATGEGPKQVKLVDRAGTGIRVAAEEAEQLSLFSPASERKRRD
jgi:hypothetical protein